jgi:hypothetical protein
LEGKADGVPRKLPGDFVGPRVSRPRQACLRSSRETPVGVQRQILYRDARSRKRDHTGQLILPIGQANEPIAAAAGALDCSSLHGPDAVG